MNREEDYKNKKSRLPQSIINQYAKYRNEKDSLKSFLVVGTRFEIPDYYEIIDSGSSNPSVHKFVILFIAFQLDKVHTAWLLLLEINE